MLTIHVIDRTAEERERLVQWLHSLLHEDTPEIEYLPRIDIKPVATDEIKFQGTPDICLVGSGLLEEELTQLGKIRKLLPRIPLIACTSSSIESLAHIEQIARLGANDTVTSDTTPGAFIRKLILLVRGSNERDSGKLIVVDSGKGGLGVTTVAAALGEVSALEGNRTALIDFDFQTQDLSRFLQVRPFVNENLQLLIEGGRPISDEFLEQCAVPVWEDEENLYHVAPPPESDLLYSGDSKILRRFVSFFEALDEKFDVVIVDAGSVSGPIQKTLYRVADEVIFLLNNDPATLYPSVDRLKKVQSLLSPTAKLTLVDNDRGESGLPRKVLRNEFSRVAKVSSENWAKDTIPYCKVGSRWPGSGSTFSTLAKGKGRASIEELASFIGLVPDEAPGGESKISQFIKGLKPKAIEIITAKKTIVSSGGDLTLKALPLPEESESLAQPLDETDTESLEKLISEPLAVIPSIEQQIERQEIESQPLISKATLQ